MNIQTLGHRLIGLVFPMPCESCGKIDATTQYGLCPACEGAISWIEAPFCRSCGRHRASASPCAYCDGSPKPYTSIRIAGVYEGVLQKILCAYKFERRKSLARLLRRFLAGHFSERAGLPTWDLVLGVPMDSPKKRDRTFNQAEELARAAGAVLGVPVDSRSLRIERSHKTQSRLDRHGRADNVRGVFSCGDAVRGKKVLLVDDIVTTGETIAECARTLLAAGAASVDVFAVARGNI